jgi:hypothetical protein
MNINIHHGKEDAMNVNAAKDKLSEEYATERQELEERRKANPVPMNKDTSTDSDKFIEELQELCRKHGVWLDASVTWDWCPVIEIRNNDMPMSNDKGQRIVPLKSVQSVGMPTFIRNDLALSEKDCKYKCL